MVKIFRRKATALALGAVAFAVLGGGIAVAAPNDSPDARSKQPVGATRSGPAAKPAKLKAQPPVSKAEADRARAALVPTTGAGMPPTAQTFAAHVDFDGTLVRGFQAVSAQRFGPGEYEVVFSHDLRGSVYVGTVGLPGDTFIPPPGEISVTGRLGVNNGVYIQTYNSAGAPADRAFYLAVHS